MITYHRVRPNSRLTELLALYAVVKPAADAAAAQLKVVTDAIKSELTAAAPGAQRIEVAHADVALQLSYVERWTLDATKLKADDPATYVRYARQGGSWRLERPRS